MDIKTLPVSRDHFPLEINPPVEVTIALAVLELKVTPSAMVQAMRDKACETISVYLTNATALQVERSGETDDGVSSNA